MIEVSTRAPGSAKLRQMADTLGRKIGDLRRSRLTNTPKRAHQDQCNRLEARNMERARDAMLAMAHAMDAGWFPSSFNHIKNLADISNLTRKLSNTQSYYVTTESNEYARTDEEAVRFRQWVEHYTPKMFDAADAARLAREKAEDAKQEKIRELEAATKFDMIPGYFPTPAEFADELVELAKIEPGNSVLEPSAGKGDIADAIVRAGHKPKCVEINGRLCEILRLKGHDVEQTDFAREYRQTARLCGIKFSRIIMNPPFEQRQDIAHVRVAYDLLEDDGRLVAVVSAGSASRSEFVQWVEDNGGWFIDVKQGAFVGAFKSTAVNVKVLVMDKEDEGCGPRLDVDSTNEDDIDDDEGNEEAKSDLY